MDGKAKVIEKTKSGEPAVVKGGNFIYILGWMDKLALSWLIKEALIRYDIKIFELHSGVRIREDSIARFWFNYSSETQNFYGKKLEPGCVYIEDL